MRLWRALGLAAYWGRRYWVQRAALAWDRNVRWHLVGLRERRRG